MKTTFSGQAKLAGCCGIYCGLCPRYQSTAKSRCPGCKALSLAISCRIFNCCVKQRGFVTCAECPDFPCEKNNPDVFQWDAFVSRKVCICNLERIQQAGLASWLKEQDERRAVLEDLIARHDEGRSKSCFCLAAALLPTELLRSAVKDAQMKLAQLEAAEADRRTRAKTVRSALQACAEKSNIALALRRKPG